MSLKPQSDKVPRPSAISPAWGELADAGHPVTAVVFECADATYSYPYHILSRWVLTHGSTDTLCVQAGDDEVTIQGRCLKSISDALGSTRLRVLRASTERYSEADDVVVSRISVKSSATVHD